MDTMKDAWHEDLALMRRLASGQREALAELYARHRLALFGYLLGICPDRETAEEVLQDTLLAAWQGAGTYQGRSSLRTWLIGVAGRQAHNRLRRRALPVAGEAELESVPSGEPGPEEATLLRASAHELVIGLRRLIPEHRQTIMLVLVGGLTYEQAARELGIPVGTVRSRLHAARKRLAELLAGDVEVAR
jgi:RNA polymerase sigma factor (sigma-70 family)